jgi:hypothetical protein
MKFGISGNLKCLLFTTQLANDPEELPDELPGELFDESTDETRESGSHN